MSLQSIARAKFPQLCRRSPYQDTGVHAASEKSSIAQLRFGGVVEMNDGSPSRCSEKTMETSHRASTFGRHAEQSGTEPSHPFSRPS
nr:hypothetical protein CFP56_62116 [Quercus suber]